MKKFIFSLCLTLVLSSNFCQANILNECSLSSSQNFKRIYFHLDKVIFENNSIFLSFENDLIPIHNILNDANGFYTFVEIDSLNLGRSPTGT